MPLNIFKVFDIVFHVGIQLGIHAHLSTPPLRTHSQIFAVPQFGKTSRRLANELQEAHLRTVESVMHSVCIFYINL